MFIKQVTLCTCSNTQKTKAPNIKYNKPPVKNKIDDKRKSYKTVIECVKVTNIFIGLKKTCLGVLDTGERDKDIETGLTEEGVIEMSTTVLHSRAAPSLCIYSPL